MSELRSDVFTRSRATIAGAQSLGATFFALVFLSLCLLLMSRLRSDIVRQVEQQVLETGLPALEWAQRGADPARVLWAKVNRALDVDDELKRLRDENERLKLTTWRVAELERKIESLERLAKVVPDPKIQFVVARAVTPGTTPFGRIALLNAGRAAGIRNGHAVVDPNGLVGRIVTAGQNASRLMLLADGASRIPVSIGRQETRAILRGDGTANPRLTLVQSEETVAVGDEVITSGVGGIIPRGLKVGTVSQVGDELRVKPSVDAASLDYVRVLIYDNPALELADDEGVPRRRGVQRRDTASVPGGR